MNELKQLEEYLVGNEIDVDRIIDDCTPYITTIINHETNQSLSFEDKEEIFADTFFLLWKNQNHLTIRVSLKSYLAGIARNLIKEKYRKLKIHYDFADFENEIEDSFSLYENEREQILDTQQKLKGLKPIDVEIINLYYYSSKSIKDIAKILDISEVNVKTRLHRARKKIKKELDIGGM